MTIEETIRSSGDLPATVESLQDDFNVLGVKSGQVLIVHSSLSSLGWVCGGAVDVVRALLAVVGQTGTLVMPTHTSELSEPSHWVNPPVPSSWWPMIRASMPPFDAQTTPSRQMGVIPEWFRTFPEVQRSNHPHLSFAALGKYAREIISNQSLQDALGEQSPVGQLYTYDASVLLLGVDHDRNTSLHLSEVRAFGDGLCQVETGAPVRKDGRREWVEFTTPEFDESDFVALGKAFVESSDGVRSGKVAMARCQLMSQREIVDFGEGWLRANRRPQTRQ